MSATTRLILSASDIELLAKMPIASGSQPRINTKALSRSWVKLLRAGVIDGGPGYYFVRWGWLSKSQYKRVEDRRFR